MADVYSAIILDDNYWGGPTSYAGEVDQDAQTAKYSTRRFTSIAAWESDRGGNGQSGDDEHGVVIGPWSSAETTTVTIAGRQADAMKIECPVTLPDGANAARHLGLYSATAYRHVTTAGSYGFNITDDVITIDGIQIITDQTRCVRYAPGSTGTSYFKNLILEQTSAPNMGFEADSANANAELENCIIWCSITRAAGSEGIYANNSNSLTIYNCTIENFNDGVERDDGDVVLKNCANFNNDDDLDGASQTEDTFNASDDGDGYDAVDWDNEATDWVANFEDYANGDFTPLDADLPTAGDGPSNDAAVPTVDIAGNTRSGTTCTIGAFEYQAAGGISIPVVMNQMNQFNGGMIC